jgi:hypothetical protein
MPKITECIDLVLDRFSASNGAGDGRAVEGCALAPFNRARIFSKSCGEIPTPQTFADYPRPWKQKGKPTPATDLSRSKPSRRLHHLLKETKTPPGIFGY